ncbi:hypothetical protein HN011_011204 [Eciton burchellii]|nr:hypothetical protein HN011_011204 [Eciton burchellii]
MPQYRSVPRYKLPSARSPRRHIPAWILKVSGERTAGIANDLGYTWSTEHRMALPSLIGSCYPENRALAATTLIDPNPCLQSIVFLPNARELQAPRVQARCKRRGVGVLASQLRSCPSLRASRNAAVRQLGTFVVPDESAFYGIPETSITSPLHPQVTMLRLVSRWTLDYHGYGKKEEEEEEEEEEEAPSAKSAIDGSVSANEIATGISNDSPGDSPEIRSPGGSRGRYLRHILLGVLLAGLACSAPAPAPKAAPAPKPLTLISELKTPASTTKLAPLIAPIATPVIAPISRIAYSAPVLSQVSPYAYAYSAPIAEIPSSYSIEQHGYHITY